MKDPRVLKFLKAAGQRWTSAEILLRLGMHLDSMYLAGYCVECSLKALLLARTPESKRSKVLLEISQGRRGHDLEYLKRQLQKRGTHMHREVTEALRRARTWSTDLRYTTGSVAVKDAERFVRGAKEVHDWAKRSL